MKRDELTRYLDQYLEADRFKDYCPNGLQVEGRAEVQRVVCGVTANQALVAAAVQRGADAVLVHHGWFWRGESGAITGFRRARLKALLAADINLIAYHLPLDAHAEVGNNVELARLAGWVEEGRFGDQNIACYGTPKTPTSLPQMTALLAGILGRVPTVIDGGAAQRPIRRVAWCSGGGEGMFERAIELGADAFVSGEVSEACVHLARETGTAFLVAGHHATERFGVQAVAAHLAERFALDCEYVDIDSPV